MEEVIMKTLCENVSVNNLAEVVDNIGLFKEEYYNGYSLDLKSLKSHTCCSSYYEGSIDNY